MFITLSFIAGKIFRIVIKDLPHSIILITLCGTFVSASMISCAIQMWEIVTFFFIFMVSVLKLGYQLKKNVLIVVIH